MAERQTRHTPRQYADGSADVPLDLEVPAQPFTVRTREQAPPAAAWANCPGCSDTEVALQRQGEHLVWKEHRYVTWSNARVTCRTSGVRVCDVPPTDGHMTRRAKRFETLDGRARVPLECHEETTPDA